MRERKQKLEGELRRLAAAAETGPSALLVEAINEREQQLPDITDQLLAQGDDSAEAHLADIRDFITERMGNLRACWLAIRGPARKELLKHISEIRMIPQPVNGESHYVAALACGILIHAQQGDFAGRLIHRLLKSGLHIPMLLVDRAGDLAPVRYADMVLYGHNASMQHILSALQILCCRKTGPKPRSAA